MRLTDQKESRHAAILQSRCCDRPYALSLQAQPAGCKHTPKAMRSMLIRLLTAPKITYVLHMAVASLHRTSLQAHTQYTAPVNKSCHSADIICCCPGPGLQGPDTPGACQESPCCLNIIERPIPTVPSAQMCSRPGQGGLLKGYVHCSSVGQPPATCP